MANTTNRDYGLTLIFIASLIMTAGIFGKSDTVMLPIVAIAIACAAAGYGLIKKRAWARWLTLAWGPLAIIVGIVTYTTNGHTISILEYASGAMFAIAWTWNAWRRLTHHSSRTPNGAP